MKVMRTLRWLTMTVLVITGAAGTGAYWVYTRSDDLLKAELLRQLAVMFPDATVDLDRAHFDLTGKVRAYHVTMTLPEEASPSLTISELVLTLDREQLADSQTIAIHKIRLVKPQVRAKRFADHTWDWQALQIHRTEGGVLPDVEIDRGLVTVQLDQPDLRSVVQIQASEIHLTALASSERSWSVAGSTHIDNLGVVQLNGEGGLNDTPWEMTLSANNFLIDQSLIAKVLLIQPELQRHLDHAEARLEKFATGSLEPSDPRSLTNRNPGRVMTIGKRSPEGIFDLGIQLLTDVTVTLVKSEQQPIPDFHVDLQIKNGRVSNPLLPLPLNDIVGHLAAEKSHVVLDDLRGYYGESLIQCSGQWSEGQHPVLIVHGEKIVIDEPLTARLPPPLQRLVRSMSLTGTCNLHAELERTESGYLPRIDLTLKRGRFKHEKFPYPVRDVEGKVNWKGDLAHVEATGTAGTAPVKITGTITHPGPGAEMVLVVQANSMPVDATLLEVSPPIVSKTIRALDMQGSGDVWARLIKPAGRASKWLTDIRVRLQDCSMKYEKFPVRIDRVSGFVTWNGETATFKHLKGYHADAEITAFGSYLKSPDPGRLELTLFAAEAPLDAELKAALPLRLQQAWEEFHPSGRFDLESRITWIPGNEVDLQISRATLKNAEVTLRSFPFPWYNVAGEFRYEQDKLTVVSLNAEHDDCQLSGSGSGTFAANQPWQFRFSELYVDDLPMSPALRRALPTELRAVIDSLNPTGTISLQGPMTFHGPDDRREEIGLTWKTKIIFSGSDLSLGLPVENVHGTVSLQGAWDGRHAVITEGALDIGSLSIYGHQLKNVQGPFQYRNEQLIAGSQKAVMGSLTEAVNSIPWEEQISAKFIDGTLTLNTLVNFEQEPRYQMRIILSHGNLEKYAQANLPGQRHISGDINGWMDLRGQGADPNQITGAGHVTISPAELYELPVFVKIFNVLGPQYRDQSAFKLADFQFEVANSRFNFKTIELSGPSLRLVGEGHIRFDGVIDLRLASTMPRNQIRIPLVSDVVGMMSQNLIGVNVTGYIKDPNVDTRMNPELDDTLQRLLSPQRRIIDRR